MTHNNLFEKGFIGKLELKNRVIMPAMGTMLATADGEISDNQIAYFEERAKGGVGLIITEVTSVEYSLGKAGSCHPRVDDNKFIPGLQRLADTIHKYGTKIFMQLHHAGRASNSMLTNGKQIVAPSPIACKVINEIPRELTIEEIKDLIQSFILGALRCKMAGIDGVELHGAHGYLINQFLSPYSNQRADEYGGSFENRMRFAKDIIEGIKKVCGKDFPVTIRLSIDEFVDGGIDINEGIKIAKYMESVGVDAINASCGIYETMPTVMEPITYGEGWRVYLAETIKNHVDIPVIAVGVIRDPKFANSILKNNQADFVAIGRGNIADPQWVEKSINGRESEIRKCISCLYCVDGAFMGHHIECAINPCAGRELEFKNFQRIYDNRKVVVIGGGPSGLEAARICALRGYNVVLFEKNNQLGGQLNFANKPNGKSKINWLIDFELNQLIKLGVDIKLGIEATVSNIKDEKPYAVFVATGSTPLVPNIDGINNKNVYSAEDILTGKLNPKDKNIAIIGAGMTGSETAMLLSSNGNKVYLIDMCPEVASGAGIINKMDIVKHLLEYNVEFLTSHKLKKISEDKIILHNLDKNVEVVKIVDKIVLALGVKSDNSLYTKLNKTLSNVILIGDANSPKEIAHAIRDGFEKAFLLK